ncbi:DUF739 family protein [Candidatus Arthromitus sp. SFB-turkey]|uniref:DUF739 family protein n=1 Tax=Candidatus Arthromitus sp. SFB-turkey TaxID=1840217 RepID=UPI0018D2E3E8|nr:DUF739 family protein [Candidatus Dwaynia gallinarum]
MSSRLNNKTAFKQHEISKAIQVLSIDNKEVTDYFFTLRSSKFLTIFINNK